MLLGASPAAQRARGPLRRLDFTAQAAPITLLASRKPLAGATRRQVLLTRRLGSWRDARVAAMVHLYKEGTLRGGRGRGRGGMSDARRIAHPVGTMLSCPLNRLLPCAVDRRQRRNTGWSSLCTLGGATLTVRHRVRSAPDGRGVGRGAGKRRMTSSDRRRGADRRLRAPRAPRRRRRLALAALLRHEHVELIRRLGRLSAGVSMNFRK